MWHGVVNATLPCQNLNLNRSHTFDQVRAETAQARSELRAVEARRDELRRVEQALVDVRGLFAQLAHLVALQVPPAAWPFSPVFTDPVAGGQ